MRRTLTELSLRQPKLIFALVLLAVLVSGAFIPRIIIDTDPENMLPADNPARQIHHEVKQRFGLNDMVVVGLVNRQHPDGIYNPKTLQHLITFTQAALEMDGVIKADMMSLNLSDNITQGEAGAIDFNWLLSQAPTDQAQALAIKASVARLPMMQNTLVSADHQAVGIYIPIISKDKSYPIYQALNELAAKIDLGANQLFITGLPVAEDTFGIQMFEQMAISAPLAGLLIFVLLLWFFRSVPLVVAPMLVAMATVIITMGIMIGLGFHVHIMASMIPIFLMPIAVVDSVHMLSDFADNYRPGKDKMALLDKVVKSLFKPMLLTSVTSMVGFISLNTAAIPPVKVFGSFIGLGIALAFILSITFIPAYISCLSEQTLEKMAKRIHGLDEKATLVAKILRYFPAITQKFSALIIVLMVLIFAVSAYGIRQIQINDNPVNWFEAEHPIRQADEVLNQHFAGTYMAFLSFEAQEENPLASIEELQQSFFNDVSEANQLHWQGLLAVASKGSHVDLQALSGALAQWQFDVEDDILYQKIDDLALALEVLQQQRQAFLQPQNVAYLERVQQALMASGLVGKSSGLPDLLKTINRELHTGQPNDYTLPQSVQANAQAILTFQSSHKPQDVWHMVSQDYRSAVIWLQLKSGDNQAMSQVLDYMQAWFAANPPPNNLKPQWSGLNYINVVWQQAMVEGMLVSLLSSFVIVALMMMMLFRSVIWGLIAMLPLSLTISLIYALIGFSGRFYDMPIAVLSALTLGMSIDFAIHFIERARLIIAQQQDFDKGLALTFEEPARAIARNAIVIAFGFTPLLFAPLVPYQTVGFFLATIMAVSCLTTLLILPAMMHLLRKFLFKLAV